MNTQDKIDFLRDKVDLDNLPKLTKCVNGQHIPMSYEDTINTLYDWNQVDPNLWIQKRRDAYPEIGQQLDAILKYLDNKGGADGDLSGIITQWKKVKTDYPKNTGA